MMAERRKSKAKAKLPTRRAQVQVAEDDGDDDDAQQPDVNTNGGESTKRTSAAFSAEETGEALERRFQQRAYKLLFLQNFSDALLESDFVRFTAATSYLWRFWCYCGFAAWHVRDAHVPVIDGDAEVIGRRAVRTRDHQVVQLAARRNA